MVLEWNQSLGYDVFLGGIESSYLITCSNFSDSSDVNEIDAKHRNSVSSSFHRLERL